MVYLFVGKGGEKGNKARSTKRVETHKLCTQRYWTHLVAENTLSSQKKGEKSCETSKYSKWRM